MMLVVLWLWRVKGGQVIECVDVNFNQLRGNQVSKQKPDGKRSNIMVGVGLIERN